ncbi:MAG: PfkB family carbohydrate kinase [Planctomycetota bacterium]|jgi:sugar/nucleoside kinase (ribokinase family)
MTLLVTGTIAIDTVHTPTGEMEGVLGGSCAYFAAAASFFTPVRIVAAVGDDWPDEHREVFTGFDGICLDGLEHRAGSRTFAWGGRYAPNMNERETLFTELGVLEEPPPPVPESYRDSAFIFLANTHPAVQMELLEHFPDRKLVVADSMDLWINIAHQELMALLSKIDGIIINDSEAEQLTEMTNAVSAGRRILDWGPAFAVIKKGEHGAILVHREGVATLPAFPSDCHQVVDPTGAGDSFAGGLMAYLASTDQTDFHSIQVGMARGTVMASFTIETFGLERLAGLNRAAVDRRLQAFQAAVRIV